MSNNERNKGLESNQNGSVDYSKNKTGSVITHALDVAQLLGSENVSLGSTKNTNGINNTDAVSLYDYIEQAEQKYRLWFDSFSDEESKPVEDLDVLNVAAEFGRPDEIADDSEDEFRDVSHLPVGTDEDTKNLKVRSGSSGSIEEVIHKKSGTDSEITSQYTLLKSSTEREDHLQHLYGKFEDARFWNVLIQLNGAGLTGILKVELGAEELQIFVQEGAVLQAASSDKNNDFLSMCFSEGYISAKTLELVRKDEADGACVREVLIKGSIMKLQDINRLEKMHFESLIDRAMSHGGGTWRFEIGKSSMLPMSSFIETPTEALIMRAYLYYASNDEIKKQIGDCECRLVFNNAPPYFVSLLMLNTDEKSIALLLRQGLSLKEISKTEKWPEEKICRFAAGLIILGYCVVETLIKYEKTGNDDDIHSEPCTQESSNSASDLLNRLSEIEKYLDKGNYFELLGLSPDSDEDAIASAVESLSVALDIRMYKKLGYDVSEGRVEAARRIVQEAYDVLQDPVRREKYRNEIV